MNDGIEKRRYNRHKANLTLNVSKLFKQDYINIRNLDSPINITDISKGGIGFRSKSILPLDFYFDAVLQLDDEKDPINCVVKIIRCQPVDNSDLYAGYRSMVKDERNIFVKTRKKVDYGRNL